MKYCDLHNHSVYSDGSDTPSELASHARECGLQALALTDHNTIDGLPEFERAAQALGLDAVLGSELTCEYNGREIHMLCMFIDLNRTQGITKFIKSIRKAKRERNVELAEKLSLDGYEIDFSLLEKRFGDNINRAHFAAVLTERGITSSIEEAFSTLLIEGGKYYGGSARPDVIKTVSDIVSWGCVPVMAHPLLSLDKNELEELLPKAKAAGLVGIEVYYSKFSSEQISYLEGLCEKYGLIKSGGSDYHGSIKPSIKMGAARVPYSCYEALKRANEQK